MLKSDCTDELAAALAKAQAQLAPAKRDRLNPYFHSTYADLASIWDACRGPLTANGLAVSQLVRSDDGASVTVETVLLHSSGQWLASSITMVPTKFDPQGIGSAITYARRYALAAIVGACSDDDDDGNAASGRTARSREAEATAAPESNDAAANKFQELLADIERASSPGELQDIAAKIRRVALDQESKLALRQAWVNRGKQLTPPAAQNKER